MSEIHGATGSYVVNALDPDEFDEFEQHLAVCPTCSHEIVEFCETAAALSLLAAAPAPPPSLRGSILASISEVRQLPPEEPAPRRAAFENTPAHLSAVPTPTSSERAPDPVVDELALRRQHRRTRILTGLVAAVSVLALALGGTVYSLVQSRQDQVVTAGAEPSLLSAPDAKIYSQTMPNGTHVAFVVSKAQNRAMFVGNDLPSPGVNKQYQLWTLQDTKATPDSLVDGGASRTQWFKGSVSDSTGLAVTIEPSGGSAVPTAPVLAVAQL